MDKRKNRVFSLAQRILRSQRATEWNRKHRNKDKRAIDNPKRG